MSNISSWQGANEGSSFPPHLETYEALNQHFRANLRDLSKTEKGDRFASSMRKLIPQTEAGADFALPVLNIKKSNDKGVDLKAIGTKDSRKVLYIQSKLWVDRADDIDSVVSKFQAYEEDHQAPQVGGQLIFNFDNPPPHFLLVTLSSLENLIKKYESRNFSSRNFYLQCKREQRISFIDGYDILAVLRSAYIKISEPPTKLALRLETPVISRNNVFIGIISSDEIKRLYSEFQDALFFENVREFQGITPRDQQRFGRMTPNDEMIKTIIEEPEKMLERNNGIVFKAYDVMVGDDEKTLILNKGSLINGCQTTMCMVEAAKTICYVSVKIVQTPDAWDITKAANHQNYVDQIDLDIARSVRPQLARRAATGLGVQIDSSVDSAFQVIDDIYDQRVAYAEVRLLFIGLFSRSPNNLFAANYTELLKDLTDKFYEEDRYGVKIYEMLFALQAVLQEGIETAQDVYSNDSYASDYNRLYNEHTLTYKCFLGILALCAVVNINIADRKDKNAEYERMKKFIEDSLSFLQFHKEEFLEYYLFAVKVWMDVVSPPDAEPLEKKVNMHRSSKALNFTNLYGRVCREADLAHRQNKLRQK